jgi:hypothetical protein
MLQPRLINTRLLPSGSRGGPPAVAGNPRPAGLPVQALPGGGAGPGASRFLNLNPGIARSVGVGLPSATTVPLSGPARRKGGRPESTEPGRVSLRLKLRA